MKSKITLSLWTEEMKPFEKVSAVYVNEYYFEDRLLKMLIIKEKGQPLSPKKFLKK